MALFVLCVLFLALFEGQAEKSIARRWNEELLAAIRLDLARPPVSARNLYSLSVVMFDAAALFDPVLRF